MTPIGDQTVYSLLNIYLMSDEIYEILKRKSFCLCVQSYKDYSIFKDYQGRLDILFINAYLGRSTKIEMQPNGGPRKIDQWYKEIEM